MLHTGHKDTQDTDTHRTQGHTGYSYAQDTQNTGHTQNTRTHRIQLRTRHKDTQNTTGTPHRTQGTHRTQGHTDYCAPL